MTPRELELLDYLRDFMAQGLSPTITMIAAQMNVSRSRAQQLVDQLIAKGSLVRADGHHRGLRLADVPDLRPIATEVLAAELARRGVTMASLNPRAPMAVGHQRTCAADTCGAAVQRGHLMCRPHWGALPTTLRERILRSNAARDRQAFERAVTEARDLIDSGQWRRRA